MAQSLIPDLLKAARTRAGLSQRGLAARSRTAQSVVARIEGGQSSPTWDTLLRLVRAAGFAIHAELEVEPARRSHMLDDVPRILSLSPEDRLLELANLSRFELAARRA